MSASPTACACQPGRHPLITDAVVVDGTPFSAAHDLAASGGSGEVLTGCSRLLHVVLTGEPARIAARLLIVSYYINLVYTQLETWHMIRYDDQAGAPPLT